MEPAEYLEKKLLWFSLPEFQALRISEQAMTCCCIFEFIIKFKKKQPSALKYSWPVGKNMSRSVLPSSIYPPLWCTGLATRIFVGHPPAVFFCEGTWNGWCMNKTVNTHWFVLSYFGGSILHRAILVHWRQLHAPFITILGPCWDRDGHISNTL